MLVFLSLPTVLFHASFPPSPQVEKEIGEKRVISFHGVGLSVAPEVRFSELAALCEVPEEVCSLPIYLVHQRLSS